MILSDEAMKPAKVISHLETKHKEFISKPIDLLKKAELTAWRNVLYNISKVDYLLVKSSYLVVFRIAKCKKN